MGNAPFRPARLSREAVEAPLPGFLARTDLKEAKRVQAIAVANRRRWAPFGKAMQRRLLRGALGGAVVSGVVGWLMLASSLGGFVVFTLLGGLAGAAVAVLALGAFLAGALFGAVAMAGLGMSGVFGITGPAGISKIVLFALIGVVLSIGEAAQRSDGD
jgi:hypothetical protein